MEPSLEDVEPAALLAEPVRRALYLLVLGRGELSRETAAAELEITRSLAAFHLDKLVEAALLVADYRRLTGRRGPGAGRPAKVYRRGDRQLRLSVPPRNYELLARLLLEAEAGNPAAGRSHGVRVGTEARRRAGARTSRRALLDGLVETLGDLGFAPTRTEGEVRLGNCPYDALAREHRDRVCGMNLEVMRGVAAGLGAPGVRATLDPRPGTCCVAFTVGRERRSAL